MTRSSPANSIRAGPDDTLITSQAREVFWEDRGVRFPLATPDQMPGRAVGIVQGA